MKKKLRAKDVEKAMRLAWGSLESHFYGTYSDTFEGKLFHKKCVREYVEQLKLLSNLY